ncbi:MAG: hypothetical protein AB8G15_10415 [Saprospiraceae bacterium]
MRQSLTSYIYLAALLLFIGSLMQCTDGKRNIKAFYYPIEALEDGKVYIYTPVNNDSLPTETWFYKSIKTDSAWHFTGQNYDQAFNVRQFFREEVVRNGLLLQDYYIYREDSLNNLIPISLEVIHGATFPFTVTDSTGIFLYSVKIPNPFDLTETTTLTRNRRYIGDDEYTYQGKSYPCVRFEIKEEVDHHIKEQGHLSPMYDWVELYAEGIGLVYYKKVISESFVLEYELKEIVSMKDFEARLKPLLEE